ncbi:MAG: hypothetical protein QG597_1533 [Actinomycetota bacterium]|nr:hypothetical protein [Actinomycetota bacterium]
MRPHPNAVSASVPGMALIHLPGFVRRVMPRLRTAPTLPSVRAGVIGAAVSVGGSYARGLLPRGATDQALATGVSASAHYLLTASSSAAAETLALYASGDHTVRDRRAPVTAQLLVDLAFITTGVAVERAWPPDPDEPMQRSLTRFVAHFAMMGGAANILVTAADEALGAFGPTQRWRNRSLLVDAALGAGLAALGVIGRRRRAVRFGLVDPDRRAVEKSNVPDTVKAAGVGAVAGVGLLAVVGTEQIVARRVSDLLYGHVGPVEVGSPWVGHAVALGMFGGLGVWALSTVKRRVERKGDVVEAAYPDAPDSDFVTSGPRSLIPFDTIGKEGRRFVLMALTPTEITAVTGAPAQSPIRVVAGFEAAGTARERADLCLAEMTALGAFEKSTICVASPTGVGYVSYVFAEALEYLTGGDCAIVMPQYALVPSALALNDTGDGAELQRLVLAGIAERVSHLPPERRPRVVQFGESLGAQVALDIAYPKGSVAFDELAIDGGLYLGVPFRTMSWNSWIQHRERFDPDGLMLAVSEPAALEHYADRQRQAMRHLMVVHHDDPVNKFGYRIVVRPPWWMGRPDTRPPKVPREVLWRPITTFVLTLVDLKNGMNFRPGTFERRGHDYRIDTVDAILAAYRMTVTDEQRRAIEEALRRREVEWARRRLVARKFAAARDSINATLSKWGVNVTTLDSLPDLDQVESLVDAAAQANEPLEFIIADRDPAVVTPP